MLQRSKVFALGLLLVSAQCYSKNKTYYYSTTQKLNTRYKLPKDKVEDVVEATKSLAQDSAFQVLPQKKRSDIADAIASFYSSDSKKNSAQDVSVLIETLLIDFKYSSKEAITDLHNKVTTLKKSSTYKKLSTDQQNDAISSIKDGAKKTGGCSSIS